MPILNNNSGHTLIEMMVAVGLVSLVAIGAMAMMVGTMSAFDGNMVQAQTDSDAVIGMQRIVSDVRESKSYQLLNNSTQLRLIMPVEMSDGSYDRQQGDTAHPVDYYLSDSEGITANSGHYLWRSKGDQKRIVARNIESVEFTADEAAETRAVVITITARNKAASGEKETHLTERVVYLRNF